MDNHFPFCCPFPKNIGNLEVIFVNHPIRIIPVCFKSKQPFLSIKFFPSETNSMATRRDDEDDKNQSNTSTQLALIESRHEKALLEQKHAMDLELEKVRSEMKLMMVNNEVQRLRDELLSTKEHHEKELKLEKELAELKAEKKNQVSVPSVINYRGSIYPHYGINFCGSILLNDTQKALLSGWKPGNWTLKYRASTHGQAASTFHSLCDNRGPTYVIVRSTAGYTFGGYAGNSWNSSSGYQVAPTSFLFVLNNSFGDAPTILPLTNESNAHAMRFHPNYGPTFGGGHDLHISNNPMSNTSSYCAISHTYVNGLGRGANTFTGASSFQVQDYEVYSQA